MKEKEEENEENMLNSEWKKSKEQESKEAQTEENGRKDKVGW